MNRATYLALVLRAAQGCGNASTLPRAPALEAGVVEALVGSNAQLVRVGRNLNQVARSLNAAPDDVPRAALDAIREAIATVEAHVRRSAAVLAELEPKRRRRSAAASAERAA
jgi:hypothetical protein